MLAQNTGKIIIVMAYIIYKTPIELIFTWLVLYYCYLCNVGVLFDMHSYYQRRCVHYPEVEKRRKLAHVCKKLA